MTITVYETSNCQRCRAVKRWLDKRQVTYTAVDASADPKTRNAILALGYTGVPVTIVHKDGKDIHFGGFNPDLLEKFCTPKDAS